MKLKELFILVFVISLMIVAGIFIGSITGQVVRGETEEFSGVEFTVILTALVIAAELAIISIRRRKKRPVDISEMVKEARKITY